MQVQLKSQQEQMNTQRERFLEVLSSFKTGPRNSDEKFAPKFDTFDVEIEKWVQYFERFEHHRKAPSLPVIMGWYQQAPATCCKIWLVAKS